MLQNLVTFMELGMCLHKKKCRSWSEQVKCFFVLYDLQIGHDAEKKCSAIKGWHSKTPRVQNRHTHPHTTHFYTHTHTNELWPTIGNEWEIDKHKFITIEL